MGREGRGLWGVEGGDGLWGVGGGTVGREGRDCGEWGEGLWEGGEGLWGVGGATVGSGGRDCGECGEGLWGVRGGTVGSGGRHRKCTACVCMHERNYIKHKVTVIRILLIEQCNCTHIKSQYQNTLYILH